MKLHWDALFFAGIELAILVNLIILDLFFFTHQTIRPATVPNAQTIQIASGCDDTCKKEVDLAVAKALSALPTPVAALPVKGATKTASSAKEFYVPFGSGSTQSDQWTGVPGVISYIDTTNYTNIQTVYFEVSMSIPTKNGIVSARLYNITDKHPVWYSEVSTDSDTSKLVTSKIQLDPGNKQYQVQLKTSLQYTSVLDFARVKILTK